MLDAAAQPEHADLNLGQADEADAAVAAFRRLMIPGNYLVISAGTSTGTDPGLISRLQAAYDDTMPVTGRTAEEVSAWFEVSPWPNPASPTSGPGAPTTRSARAKSRLREPDSWPPPPQISWHGL
jgi:hypothetical protein